MIDLIPDHILIQQILHGNKDQFRVLYQRYSRDLFLVCLRYSKNKSDAEDFLQDSCIQIFNSLSTFDADKSKFLTWSKKITIYTCLQHLRKKSISFMVESLFDNINIASQSMNGFESLSLQELTNMVQKLPSGYRTIFNMYAIDGFTHKEISLELNISTNTSKSQYHKAKQYLKKLINQENIVFQYG